MNKIYPEETFNQVKVDSMLDILLGDDIIKVKLEQKSFIKGVGEWSA